jgi:hypothetical protein
MIRVTSGLLSAVLCVGFEAKNWMNWRREIVLLVASLWAIVWCNAVAQCRFIGSPFIDEATCRYTSIELIVQLAPDYVSCEKVD